jgi:hypothetical protein
VKLSKRQLACFNYKAWKDWAFDPRGNMFFFFCCLHWPLLKRDQDGLGDIHGKPIPVCDYPGCTQIADKELFPYLVTIIKNAEKEFKNGKRVQSKAVSKKRSKKA